MRHVCLNKSSRCPVEPATLIGLSLLVETVSLLAINIFSPPPCGANPSTGLPQLNPAMTLLMQPLSTAAYFVILVGFTGWLQIHRRASSVQCGWAAAKIVSLASIPTLLAALLICSHILGVVVLGPGGSALPFRERGIALTYYSADPHTRAGWLLLAWVLFRLPGAFVLGVVGGTLGRWTNQLARILAQRAEAGTSAVTRRLPVTRGCSPIFLNIFTTCQRRSTI